jgi:S-adenosylmethionine-dependent methyltransferase
MGHPFPITPDEAKGIEEVLLRTYFFGWDAAHMASENGRRDIEAIVFRRYDECLGIFVPWIQRHLPLAGQMVVEIGCGAGSSTSAIARYAGHIDAYDIDARAVEGAEGRARVLGQKNIDFYVIKAETLLSEIRQRHTGGRVDVVLLYAVLEHQHPLERLDTLSCCWDLLRPGGLLVVIETPNRLAYFDGHTSILPFFSMLPPEVAIRYAKYSPREVFVRSIGDARSNSDSGAQESLARWGRGVSYHEFQLSLGENLDELLVGDGFDPEILGVRPVSLSERCLYTYWKDSSVAAPVAFVRQDLDLIFRKPDGSNAPSPRPAPPITALAENSPVAPPVVLTRHSAFSRLRARLGV